MTQGSGLYLAGPSAGERRPLVRLSRRKTWAARKMHSGDQRYPVPMFFERDDPSCPSNAFVRLVASLLPGSESERASEIAPYQKTPNPAKGSGQRLRSDQLRWAEKITMRATLLATIVDENSTRRIQGRLRQKPLVNRVFPYQWPGRGNCCQPNACRVRTQKGRNPDGAVSFMPTGADKAARLQSWTATRRICRSFFFSKTSAGFMVGRATRKKAESSFAAAPSW